MRAARPVRSPGCAQPVHLSLTLKMVLTFQLSSEVPSNLGQLRTKSDSPEAQPWATIA